MAYRSLSDLYLFMRGNAITNKNFYHDQTNDDREALVMNLENGYFGSKTYLKNPPEWANEVNQVQFDIKLVKNKMKDLTTLHDKYLTRPTLDDNTNDEKVIDALTQEITKILNIIQIKIKKISNQRIHVKNTEHFLIKNVVTSLAKSLQDITYSFRKAQNAYLNRIKSREERSKLPLFDNNLLLMDDDDNKNSYKDNEQNYYEQMQIVNENRDMLNEREKEIMHIVKSIQDLNEIFKDLATMIVDQGTILDRIDYNIEKTSISVQQGLQELQKASKYQKKNRKMYCIVILAIIVMILFVLLLLVKI